MRTRERTATLTTTEACVLGQLAIEGERSGYDLLKLTRKAVGEVWAPAKSQLYSVLPRLVRDGLALARAGGRDRGPDRQLYRISAAGSRALAAWLEDVRPHDDATILKVFLGGLTDRETLVAQVERYRADNEERLAELRAIEQTNTRQGYDHAHSLVLRLGLVRCETALAWADEVLAELQA
jgi:DNA-binding PadR family transcriptional regulator